MSSANNPLRKILLDLTNGIQEIEAAAIVSVEGLPIDSVLPNDVDEAKIAAMTAAILSLGERASLELNKGELEQVLVTGKNGFLAVQSAGLNACLTVSASPEAKLGLIMHYMKQAAREIEKII